MNIYIDTEFNDFEGKLISMALVAADGEEFYEVLECKDPSSWVAENVMPYLEKEPVTMEIFQEKLQDFIYQYEHIHIIADWPEDIKHFCESLITGPGLCLNYPKLTMESCRFLSSAASKVPHNALHDARAVAEQHIKSQQNEKWKLHCYR